ncbi:hypothetical protein TIFTF001_020506 [Ficus carica]|uniref:Uncharacterized protein n=1 Tax=Ficus carica TaxID=3494 RepID=A0AA88AF23_FICCA|nr:hypothetical protein TIFTF001_020506 [Ficus carica]
MMKAMFDKFDKAKEHKQRLLVDTDVDDEIELFEESVTEAGEPSSAPITSIEHVSTVAPTTNEPGPIAVEPLTFDGPSGNPPKCHEAPQ